MTLEAIVAMDGMGGIGLADGLPWGRLSSDMDWFRSKTVGKAVIMGRRTWETLGGKPLRNRLNIVVSRTMDPIGRPSVRVVRNRSEALEVAQAEKKQPVIIGGSQIYKLFERDIQRWYLTKVHSVYNADTILDIDFGEFEQDLVHDSQEDGVDLGFYICERVPVDCNGAAEKFVFDIFELLDGDRDLALRMFQYLDGYSAESYGYKVFPDPHERDLGYGEIRKANISGSLRWLFGKMLKTGKLNIIS